MPDILLRLLRSQLRLCLEMAALGIVETSFPSALAETPYSPIPLCYFRGSKYPLPMRGKHFPIFFRLQNRQPPILQQDNKIAFQCFFMPFQSQITGKTLTLE